MGGSPLSRGLADLPSLVLIPLHTTPKAVEQELNALYDVFLDASRRWKGEVGWGRWHGGEGGQRGTGWPGGRTQQLRPLQDIILLGDFNADCGSLAKKRLGELTLRTRGDFYWAIADGEDTTVRASTHCAYDRIVLHGERCRRLLHAASAFNFPRSFRLTEEEVTRGSGQGPGEGSPGP